MFSEVQRRLRPVGQGGRRQPGLHLSDGGETPPCSGETQTHRQCCEIMWCRQTPTQRKLVFVDLHLLGGAEELRGLDSPLVCRAHAVPSELLPARTDAAPPAGQTATAARRREPGGQRGAGEGGE